MTNSEILCSAMQGIETLKERQKQQVKEHVERIKRLQIVIAEVLKGRLTNQLVLDGVSTMDLAPELRDLLENPTHGL